MNLRIYNHQFLTDDSTWVFGFLDQIKLMEDSGLLEAVDVMNLTAIGNNNQQKILTDLIKDHSKVQLHAIDSSVTQQDVASDFASLDNSRGNRFVSEAVTINRLWTDSAKDDFYALYIHGKGVTAYTRFLMKNDAQQFRNYYYWRKFLEWGTVENWHNCVNALHEGYDVAGCNFNNDPWPHFSGNIWWARSRYIRTLDDNTDSAWWRSVRQHYHTDRLCDEMWPCSHAKRVYNIHSPGPELCSPNPGLYSKAYLRKNYEQN